MISIILFLVVLVVLLIDRNDASSPGTLSYCNIGPNYKYGKGSSVMSWVEAPINADFYTVRTADGANTANDPTSYVPDKWMPIHIRVNDLRRKFIGLVMYAINSGDDNKKVGEWKINPTDPYRLPTACGGQAVTHSDANIKPMHSVIYFRAPKGTGTVTFRVMIKQGEQGKGNFFYPTKVLTLSEGAVQTSAPKVYLSKAGESCDNACGTAGRVCDLQQTVALSSASSLTTATWGEVSCAYPAIAGCSATVPMQSTNNNYCYFKNTACQSSQQPAATSCGAKADGISRICACTNSVTIDSSTGNSGPSNKGSSSTGTTTISGSSTGLYPGGKSSTGSNGSNSKSSTGSNGSNSTGRQGSTGSSGSDVDDSSSTGDEIWWPAGDDDYSSTGRRGAASSASNSRPLFIVPLLTFLFHSTRSSTTFLLLSLLSLFLFISPSSVSAHNWVHSPSRALVASVSKPCQARIGNQPHIQVGKGQTFQMEWSVGHGDFWWAMNYYFVIIKAEDYDQLNFITETEMEKYLEEAPQASVLTGNSWLKRHVWQNKDGVPPSKYFRAQAPTNPSDPYYIERDSVMIQKETFPGPADKWTVVAFLDNCTALDKRAAYTNGKWPFIQSVHRFRNPLYEHSIFAHQWSIANFQIPSSMPAGDYIAYFTWAGYRDCVDIDVRDTTVQNRYGLVPTSNTPKVYVKMEHCEFSNVQEASTPCTKVPANGDISACINACSTSYCRAVQVARVKNPAGTLPFTENIPWTPYDYTKYPNGCGAVTVHDRALAGCTGNAQNCDKTKLGTLQDSDYICYGLNPFRDENIQVAEDYEFGTESQDPKFYSTCYLKMNDEGFLSRPAITPSKLAWVAGDKCVQCSTRNSASSKSLNVITDWYPAVTDICTNCDEPTK